MHTAYGRSGKAWPLQASVDGIWDFLVQVLLYTQAGFTAEELCNRAATCFDLDVHASIRVSTIPLVGNNTATTCSCT